MFKVDQQEQWIQFAMRIEWTNRIRACIECIILKKSQQRQEVVIRVPTNRHISLGNMWNRRQE